VDTWHLPAVVTFARATTRDLKGKGLELGVGSADEPSSSALRCNAPSRIQGPTSTNRRGPKPAIDTCLVIPAAHLRVDARTLLNVLFVCAGLMSQNDF
jgi:hypothetical protein